MQKTSINTIYHGIEHRNDSFEKIWFKSLQKIPFGEGQVKDPIQAPAGQGSKISAVLLGGT
jgi:hypothetical protein